jgi:ABC-2 type transport system permease protein
MLIGAAQALVVLLAAALIPAIDFRWQYGVVTGVLLALFCIVALNFFLAGLGQALASRIRSMQGFHLVMNLVLFPFLFLSGAFFPLDGLPMWLRMLGMANPLSYAVDLLQLALYAPSDAGYFGVAIDVAVTLALATGVSWLGTSRRLEV